jgi:ABC-type bacteriocin/lantibiotic exporter with double-glycine peptidase domain
LPGKIQLAKNQECTLKNLFKNIIRVLKEKERKQFYWLIALNTVINIADIFSIALLLLVINFYIHPQDNLLSFLPGWLSDPNSPALITLFLLIFSLKNLFAYIIARSQSQYAYNVAGRISKEELLNYFGKDYPEYIHSDSSVYIRKIGQQPMEFCQYVLTGTQQVISQAILILLSIAGVLLFKAKLFVLLLVILLPPVFLTAWLMKRKLKSIRFQTRVSSEKALQHLKEALNGYVESHIYNADNFFSARYGHFQSDLNNRLSDLQIIQGVPNRLMEIFAVLGLFILILINQSAGVSSGNFIIIGAFMAAAYKIIPGIVKIINLGGQISAYKFTVEGLADANKNKSFEKESKAIKELDSVHLKNISFNYSHCNILENFSLCIQKGDFLVIEGESGTGKTTLLNLLSGFLVPLSGDIVINKIAMHKEDLKSYRARIAYVKQQCFLIHDTLLRNITLQENNYNVDRLRYAMETSGLDQLVETWPERLNKIITENGKNISGGQRQRIAIARAIYKNPDMIVLDEPFSELDKEAECELLKKLRKLSQAGKIIILVTHNKESLPFSTKRISLDEG